MKILLTIFCCCLVIGGYSQQVNPVGSLSKETGLLLRDDVTRTLIQTSSGDRAYDYVRQISMWDRSGYEQNYNDAANWVKTKAAEFGLSEVTIENSPAEDGAWIVKKGELSAVAPYLFKITSYDDLPMSLAMNSASIDTTAELIDVGNGLAESDYEGKDVKNKIVLTNQSPSAVARIAMVKKGAIGVVSAYSVPYWDFPNRLPGDFPDQVGWSGIYLPNDQKAFAFMISERKLRELRSILDRKEKILLKVSIETEKKPGSIKIVSGIIKGSQFPEEEIIITAHLDHYKPGANDNASGCSVTLEMARTLNYLISVKQIPPPLRTIRFLWLPEFSGTVAWFGLHVNDNKKRIVNLNFDMLGANVVEVNSQLSVNYTPDWNGHFINSLSESTLDFINKYNDTRYARRKDYQIISVNGSRNPARGVMKAYSRGSDHQIFNDYGIAGIGFSTWPDDNYHSSQDSPNHVDPTQLHRVAVGGLTLITTCAYSSADNAEGLLAQVFTYGQNRLADDERKALKLVYSSQPENLATNAYLAKAVLQIAFAREQKSLQSCQLLTGKSDKLLSRYSQLLNQREVVLKQNLSDLILLRASELKLPSFKESKIEADENKYTVLIPERLKGKELFSYFEARPEAQKNTALNLADLEKEVTEKLNELREQETEELVIYDFYNAMASYADGKRSIVDIRNAIYAEYGALFTLASIEKLFRVFESGKAMVVKTKK
jgi:hypothetical protein